MAGARSPGFVRNRNRNSNGVNDLKIFHLRVMWAAPTERSGFDGKWHHLVGCSGRRSRSRAGAVREELGMCVASGAVPSRPCPKG